MFCITLVVVKKHLTAVVLCCLLVSTGCYERHYHAAFHGTAVAPLMPAPVKFAPLNVHIAAEFGSGAPYHLDESTQLLRGRIFWSSSTDNIDGNAGFIAYSGWYTVADMQEYSGTYNYFGLAPTLNEAIHFSLAQTDIGFGVNYSIAFEGGEYLTFRRESEKAGLADNNTKIYSSMFSVYPIIRQNFSNGRSITFMCPIGQMGLSPTMTYNSRRMFLWLLWMPGTLYEGSSYSGPGIITAGFGLNKF